MYRRTNERQPAAAAWQPASPAYAAVNSTIRASTSSIT